MAEEDNAPNTGEQNGSLPEAIDWKARAEVVAEGAKKSGYEQPITPKEGKRFTVQCTMRVSKQLQWADEDNQLQILDAIQADQAAALGEALDYVIYHAVNPASGDKLAGYEALSAAGVQVTATDDQLANLDLLTDRLLRANITGVALSRTLANELRMLRVSNTGGRLFPEIPLSLNTGTLDGIKASTSVTVEGVTIHSLRHTYASIALANGADVKTLQKQLGHATATMTLDTYAALWPDRLDNVAHAVSQAWQPHIRPVGDAKTKDDAPAEGKPPVELEQAA